MLDHRIGSIIIIIIIIIATNPSLFKKNIDILDRKYNKAGFGLDWVGTLLFREKEKHFILNSA